MAEEVKYWGVGVVGLKQIDKTKAEIANMLNASNWANEFSWYEIDKMAAFLAPYHAAKGEVIFYQGTHNVPIGLILSGRVGITKEKDRQKESLIATLGPGATFGEMSMIDKEPSSATAFALISTTILTMTTEQFDSLIKKNPALATKFLLKIARLISQRLRKTSGQLVDLFYQVPTVKDNNSPV